MGDTVAGQRSLSYAEMAFLDSWEPSLADLEDEILHASPRPSHGATHSNSCASSRPTSASRSRPVSGFGAASRGSCSAYGWRRADSTPEFPRAKTPGLLKLPTMKSTTSLRQDIVSSLRSATQQLRDEVQQSK